MKTILITGASGFLGRHLTGLLLEQERDAQLRLLSRTTPPFADRDRVQWAQGDVTALEDLAFAMKGVQEVYHLAGVVLRQPANPWLLYRTHVKGARNVCDAMGEFKVEKGVVVSSSGTFAVSREPVVHDETSGYAHQVVAEWPYYLSKIYAEKQARWYVKHKKLPLTIVNPSLLLGPGDERGSSTGDVALFLSGQILTLPRGGLNFVDVRDAARGVMLAMRHGAPGERYLLGGPNWTFRELIRRVAEIAGRRPPRISLPLSCSLAGAKLMRRLWRLRGRRFELDDASIKMSELFWYCDSSKARDELTFKTRLPAETLQDTVEYLRSRAA